MSVLKVNLLFIYANPAIIQEGQLVNNYRIRPKLQNTAR